MPRFGTAVKLHADVHPAWIGDTRAARIAACGVQGRGTTADAERVTVTYRCGDRYCKACGDDYRRRAFACILQATAPDEQETAADVDRPVMLTLTHRDRHAIEQGEQGAAAARDELAAHWRAATRLLQRSDAGYARARTEETRSRHRRAIPPPSRATSTTWDEGQGWQAQGCRDYVRTWEWTGADTYHAHLHVLCRNVAVAERLNAAWQHTRWRWQLRFCQTRFETRDREGRDFDRRMAVRYVCAYVTQGEGLDAVRDAVSDGRAEPTIYDGRSRDETYRRAVVRASKGLRRLQGSGRFRRLGLRREPKGRLVQVDSHAGEFSPQQWVMYGAIRTHVTQRVESVAGAPPAAVRGGGKRPDAEGVSDALRGGERSERGGAAPCLEHVSNNCRTYRLTPAPARQRPPTERSEGATPRRSYRLRPPDDDPAGDTSTCLETSKAL